MEALEALELWAVLIVGAAGAAVVEAYLSSVNLLLAELFQAKQFWQVVVHLELELVPAQPEVWEVPAPQWFFLFNQKSHANN